MARDETLAGTFKISIPRTDEEWLKLVKLRLDVDVSPLLGEFSLPTLGDLQCVYNDDLSSTSNTKMLRSIKGLSCLTPEGRIPSLINLQTQGIFLHVDFLFHDLDIKERGVVNIWGLTRNETWILGRMLITRVSRNQATYGHLLIETVSLEELLPFAEKIWFGLGDFVKSCKKRQDEKLKLVSRHFDHVQEEEMLFRIARIS